MRYKCKFDRYKNEIIVFRVLGDGSEFHLLRFYEKKNFIHLDVSADKFRHFDEFDKTIGLLQRNMSGINIEFLYSIIVDNPAVFIV